MLSLVKTTGGELARALRGDEGRSIREDEQFGVYGSLLADHPPRQREVERFSLDILELPQSCLRRSIVNVYSKYSRRKRRNMLPYGTCRVAVHRSHVVQTIYGAIQEYGGFDRPGVARLA